MKYIGMPSILIAILLGLFAVLDGAYFFSFTVVTNTNTANVVSSVEDATPVSDEHTLFLALSELEASLVFFERSRNLMLHDTGEDVRTLQKFLNAEGALLAEFGPGSPGEETDYFGLLTYGALVRWQQAHGVQPASGFMGPVTRAAVIKKNNETRKKMQTVFDEKTSTSTTTTTTKSTTVTATTTITSNTSTSTEQMTNETTEETIPPVVVIGGGGGGPIPSPEPENERPLITILGSDYVEVSTGATYTDPGATATDAEDGDLTSSIVVGGDVVNTFIPETYVITYDVSDSKGDASDRVSRSIVVNPPAPLDPSAQEPLYTLTPLGETANISISSSKNADPKLTNVVIDPLHVYVGQTQTLSVDVTSASPITSVTATTKLDTQTITLALEETSPGSGTFSASWVVFDTHVKTYHTTFTAVNEAGQSNSVTLAWSDPCAGVTQGVDSSLSADCTVSAVDGLDAGSLTIPSGKTLTLNSGATWAFNPGNFITINGSIALNGTASLKKGYLFYSGSTNDTAVTSSSVFDTNSTKASHVRVGTWFKFTDQEFAARSSIITSNTVTIGGISDGTAVTLSGTGASKQMSINGGPWGTTGNINNGETLRVRLTSSSSYFTTTTVTATVGGTSSTFSVTTEENLL